MLEQVRGTIIGQFYIRYTFWTRGENPRLIARCDFERDREAIAWFAATYPKYYRLGVEMRVYD